MNWQSIQQVKAAIDKAISDGLIHDLKLNGATKEMYWLYYNTVRCYWPIPSVILRLAYLEGFSSSIRQLFVRIHYMHLPFYNMNN